MLKIVSMYRSLKTPAVPSFSMQFSVVHPYSYVQLFLSFFVLLFYSTYTFLLGIVCYLFMLMLILDASTDCSFQVIPKKRTQSLYPTRSNLLQLLLQGAVSWCFLLDLDYLRMT